MYIKKLRCGGILAVIGIFTALVLVFVGAVWWTGRDHARVAVEAEYYFLVRDCEETTSAAIVGEVYGAGGAGYLMGSSVVVACYYLRADAERVQTAMEGCGVETRVLEREGKIFSLNGKKAAQAAAIEANARTVDVCARVLYDGANGLERGSFTQEDARAAVRGVVDSLKGLRAGNTGSLYARWNAELYQVERDATEIARGILFSKDLRRLQVRLCLAVLDLGNYFS